MSRFLLAFIRNFGVAIAISVFFAAARGPSQPSRPVDALVTATASHPGPVTPTQRAAEYDRPSGRVVDAGEQTSSSTP
jgi:hypothetical protein